MTRSGRRIVFVSPGQPLECREVTIPDPEPGWVLLRTVIGGVCGTDAHRLEGDLPAAPFPIAFGHEGIGRIDALGRGVCTDSAGVPVTLGDLVYWSPSGDRPGVTPVTGWPPPANVPSAASYQDFASLPPSNIFYRIPDDTSPESVITFGCAMPTAIGALARLGGITAGQSIVIQGSGPVGLALTVLSSLSAARQVIVIGAPDNRLAAATRFGATTTLPLESTTVMDRKEAIEGLTDGHGADVVMEATGRMEAFPEGMDLLANNGRYLVVGLYSGHGTVPLDPIRLNNRNQAVIGSFGPATHEDYRTTVHLAQRHGVRLGFADLITHRFPLSRTSDAIAAARTGNAIKAVVLTEGEQ